MPNEKRCRRRSDNWLRDALPHYQVYKSVVPGRRTSFFEDLCKKTGLAVNTLRRQMFALNYLDSKNLDLNNFIYICPPVMAIEALARIGKIDVIKERRFLDHLLDRRVTIAEILSEAKIIEKSIYVPSENVIQLSLSEIIKNELFKTPRGKNSDTSQGSWANFEFHLWIANGPYLTVDQGPGRVTDIIVASLKKDITEIKNFSQLENSVFRSLLTSDRTILCTDMEIPRLNETVNRMKPDIRSKLIIRYCRLVVDVSTFSGRRSVWRLSQGLED